MPTRNSTIVVPLVLLHTERENVHRISFPRFRPSIREWHKQRLQLRPLGTLYKFPQARSSVDGWDMGNSTVPEHHDDESDTDTDRGRSLRLSTRIFHYRLPNDIFRRIGSRFRDSIRDICCDSDRPSTSRA